MKKYYAVCEFAKSAKPGIYTDYTKQVMPNHPKLHKSGTLDEVCNFLIEKGFTVEEINRMRKEIEEGKSYATTDNIPKGMKKTGVTATTEYKEKDYILVFLPGTFVLNGNNITAKKCLKSYKKVKTYKNKDISESVCVYEYQNEKDAIEAANKLYATNKTDTTLKECTWFTETMDEKNFENKIENKVYVVDQKEAVISVKAKWDDINFANIISFKARAGKDKEYIEKQIKKFESANYYNDKKYTNNENTFIFTDGSRTDTGIGYGVFIPDDNLKIELTGTKLTGTGLEEIIEEVNKINEKKQIFEDFVEDLNETQNKEKLEKYINEGNEFAELLAAIRAALWIIENEHKNSYICYDNENVFWYLTGMFGTKEDKFNSIYKAFYEEVFKYCENNGYDINYMHIYSHVIESEEEFSSIKPISLNNNRIFENHVLFKGNKKADDLANKAVKNEVD